MIEEIKRKIEQAEQEQKKLATFHLEILLHAEELSGYDPKQLCEDLGLPAPYATEFRQMLALSRLLQERSLSIS
jgi:hypothetical protein